MAWICLNMNWLNLSKSKDYKTINILLRSNPYTWLFNTRKLNEEIPGDEIHFNKRKGLMKCETKQ